MFWGFWELSFESVNSWEPAMAEIFTPLSHSARVADAATQPLSHSATDWVAELLQPLWQSGWVAGAATLAEWLGGCSTHSGRVAEWLSGWVVEWLLQLLWQSGWVAAPATLAEWLSGWVAPPATVAERLSGWVAAAESSANEMDKVFKHLNIQARLYDIDSNLIYKHNPVGFNCHSYITNFQGID